MADERMTREARAKRTAELVARRDAIDAEVTSLEAQRQRIAEQRRGLNGERGHIVAEIDSMERDNRREAKAARRNLGVLVAVLETAATLG